MSEENVETFRESLKAFDRRDRAAWLAARDQDYEVITIRDWPEADVHGREAGWDFYVEVTDAFQPGSTHADHIAVVDAGPNKLLAHERNDLRGRESGAGVELNYWLVVTFREDKILRDQWFADRDEALDAAGLSE
jgi:ketosteroid isomerase-like protein